MTVSRRFGRRLPIRLLFGCCALLLLLAGCGESATTHQSPSTPVPLPPLPPIGGLPAAAAGAQVTGSLSPTLTLHLTIGLATNRQALADDLAALYDPASPRYGQFLTPAQIAARYGAPQSAIDKVSAYLSAQGFQILSVSALHDSLTVSATVAQIVQALHIALAVYQKGGTSFFGPTGEVSLPPDIAQLITSILGLNTLAQPSTKPPKPPVKPPVCKGQGGVSPSEVAAVYHYSDAYKAGYTGQGISIGVVEFNDAVSEQDLTTFLTCTTGGKLHRQVIKVAGGAQNTDDNSTGEAELDFEYLSALSPDAQLLEYQSDFCQSGNCGQNELSFPAAYEAVLNQIAQEGRVQVASTSWGGEEQFFSQGELHTIDQTIQRLAAEGITLAVASGDCAAFDDGTFNRLSIDFPGSAPYALDVGGTLLQTDGKGHRTTEPAWSNPNPNKSQCNNDWGSGGGLSVVWKQPAWQKGAGVKNQFSTGFRQAPDVAAISDDLPLYFQGRWYLSGGTSAAAPIWAAGIALVDQGLKGHHKPLVGGAPTFYQVANKGGSLHPYYDVTQGDNIFYKTGAGWDYPTGWGAPNILDFGKVLGAF